jgi:hypothetical protein
MIKVGDRVKFLNDVGGGIVTGFIGKNLAKVENDDGFEVPYPVSKLLNVDDPALNRGEVPPANAKVEESPVVQTAPDKGKILPGKEDPNFYFCCVPAHPGNPLAGNIDLFLVNDSNFTLLCHYTHFINGQYETVFYDAVPSNSKILLESIGLGDLNDLPEYGFHLIFFRYEEKECHPAILKKFKMNPVRFYKEKSFRPNAFFDRDAMVYQITEDILNTEIDKLTEEDFRKVVKAKEKNTEEKKPSKPVDPEIVEVDLHIHELVENTTGLTNKEILEIQMEKVEREMHAAIHSQVKRIVFIHGIGQGVLKQEIAKLLNRKFPKYIFQDASFKEYGFGATMVILRK